MDWVYVRRDKIPVISYLKYDLMASSVRVTSTMVRLCRMYLNTMLYIAKYYVVRTLIPWCTVVISVRRVNSEELN